jgi:hypothetical protein
MGISRTTFRSRASRTSSLVSHRIAKVRSFRRGFISFDFWQRIRVRVEPKQWINATTLVLLATQEWDDADDPEKTHECKQTIRIVFDSAGKVSAKLLKETHE